MISVVLYRVIVLTIGTLYPAYCSYKAVRTKNAREYVKWMTYWIVFAFLTVAEAIGDIFVAFWFPFYYETKIAFILYLISPWTKGAALIYKNWLHLWLIKNERDIDVFIEKIRAEAYNQVASIGAKGLTYARNVVAIAAIRGHEQLVRGPANRLPVRKNPSTLVIEEVDDEEDEEEEEVQSIDNAPATAELLPEQDQDDAEDDSDYEPPENHRLARSYNLRSRNKKKTRVVDDSVEDILI